LPGTNLVRLGGRPFPFRLERDSIAEFALLDSVDYRYNPSRLIAPKNLRQGAFEMAEDFRELEEQAEEAAQHNLAPVTVTMAILAVLVAAVSLLGHRAHTEEMLMQTRATDHWAYYQAKEIRRRNYELFVDEMSVFALQKSEQADKIKEKYQKEIERYKEEGQDIQAEARKAEEEVAAERRHANYFDLGEVLLEAALVICSITVLTRKRFFWYLGTALGLIGLGIGITGLLVR
jgi:hypothetical protein